MTQPFPARPFSLGRRRFAARIALPGAFLGTGLAGPLAPAFAQSAFPNRPIRYIVPVSAGGGSDMIGRAVCERLAAVLKTSIVVENIAGAGGAIASQTTAKAAPDGYTLMQGYVATHGTAPAVRPRIGYDAIADYTPIGMIGATPNVLCVSAAVPARSIAEFIALLKAQPGRLSYGSAGAGSLTHLTGELFKQITGTFMVHIPYRGIAPAITDLIAGQTQAMFPGLAAALPHIRSGRLRPLAVTGLQRHAALRDVPTMQEAGLKGFDAQQWYGVVGPARMPADVVRTLSTALNQVLSQPDFKDKLAAEAVELMPMSPEAFGSAIRADLERWTRLVKERRIEPD
jgi:tripartite-type tricarboxylate transporter receptor subunit TctC